MIAKQTAVVLLEPQNNFLSEDGKLYPLLKAAKDPGVLIKVTWDFEIEAESSR